MISVFVAAYNGEKYIRQQLESIAFQNMDGVEEELEIIISDDCSNDGTLKVLQEFQREISKETQKRVSVKITEHQKPSGSAQGNFFRMFREWDRKSSYIMLSDQDDVWMEDKVKKLYIKMKALEEAHGTHTPILLHTDAQVTDESLNVLHKSLFAFQNISPERNRLNQLLVQNNVTGGTVMMNRSLALLLTREPEICLMHDAWIALVASAFGVTGWVAEPLSKYRQHGNNTLGAESASSLAPMVKRLRDKSASRENYRRMFGQAACLLSMFSDKLTGEQKKMLTAFADMKRMGRIRKIITVFRFGFTKNTWLRTLGQLISIGI